MLLRIQQQGTPRKVDRWFPVVIHSHFTLLLSHLIIWYLVFLFSDLFGLFHLFHYSLFQFTFTIFVYDFRFLLIAIR